MYKRPIASTYSLSSLKGYEPYIDGMIEKFMGILDQHDASNEPINMSNWLHYWAFDMISKMSFGEPIGFLDHGSDFNGMIKSQKRFFRYISIVNNMPILDSLLKRNPFLKLVKQKPSMFFTFTKRIVTERIAQAEREKDKKEDPEAEASSPGPAAHHHRDMLGSFIEARKTYPQIMTDLRIAHLSTTNVVAGANDSASSMDKVIHYLAGHPDAQERLYNEITSVVNGTATAVKEKDSREKDKDSKTEGEGPAALELALKMPFLEAIVLESYRTFGVPSNNMERIVPQSGMRLPNGVQLPPGAVIAMNAASMAMLPHIFGADVKEFNPDRWFQAPTESDAEYASRRHAMDRAAGMVFGHGSRGCIGKNVVQLEMFKLWASLVRVYRVSLSLAGRLVREMLLLSPMICVCIDHPILFTTH
ncbi:hypothetical protein A1O3_06736 [Capronia epimyces CBS 606.96]|uniref:Cytochrome P450 oxidoreductase n=1 Tax=Capronia epimyces CBS 606.96 TaxID=1182542 RepID=W9XZZ1_9EURO|nr:uncharacterized protein A1O3_06736 [Capronia epimyces CBS 606.96]EXJ82920.1 hypothetical protein A1O3_06736 [Capronia epimyces CBS 606.96]